MLGHADSVPTSAASISSMHISTDDGDPCPSGATVTIAQHSSGTAFSPPASFIPALPQPSSRGRQQPCPPNSSSSISSTASNISAASSRPPPRERHALTPAQLRTRFPDRAILQSGSLASLVDWWQTSNGGHGPQRIIVMCGAGVSTAAGIPDFRSPGTGLYSNLAKFDLPYAEAIFDVDYFREKPEAFYALARELYPGQFKPTLSHYFIRLLSEKGRLLRLYTQNIDTLERVAGITEDVLVEAHGSFHRAACIDCKADQDTEYVRARILAGAIPRCTACLHGCVKPCITFFGESLPQRYHDMSTVDFKKCDLLIVMGTSLKVHPFASLIDAVGRKTPRLLVNREIVGVRNLARFGFDFDGSVAKYRRDAVYQGSCDDGVRELTRLLGWEDELVELWRRDHARIDERVEGTVVEGEFGNKAAVDAGVGSDELLAAMLERVHLVADHVPINEVAPGKDVIEASAAADTVKSSDLERGHAEVRITGTEV